MPRWIQTLDLSGQENGREEPHADSIWVLVVVDAALLLLILVASLLLEH